MGKGCLFIVCFLVTFLTEGSAFGTKAVVAAMVASLFEGRATLSVSASVSLGVFEESCILLGGETRLHAVEIRFLCGAAL